MEEGLIRKVHNNYLLKYLPIFCPTTVENGFPPNPVTLKKDDITDCIELIFFPKFNLKNSLTSNPSSHHNHYDISLSIIQ